MMTFSNGEKSMMNYHTTKTPSEFEVITATAEGGNVAPVLILNLNRYSITAGYPDGAIQDLHGTT